MKGCKTRKLADWLAESFAIIAFWSHIKKKKEKEEVKLIIKSLTNFGQPGHDGARCEKSSRSKMKTIFKMPINQAQVFFSSH